MEKFAINLWFDKEASEAADFYLSIFKDSKELARSILNDTPSGTVEIITIDLAGLPFMLMSAGPYFKINPSISFMIMCSSEEEVRYFYDKLIVGGFEMMPLDKYDFSPLYAWVADRYGVSWQIFHTNGAPIKSKIIPSMMYVGENVGHVTEAVKFYTSVFKRSKIGNFSYYGEGQEPNKPEYVNYVDFELEGVTFSAMESALDHGFTFNEGVSIIVNCDSQDEIDYYWEALSAVPEAEQCGWLKDRFGVSWRITPKIMDDMMRDATPEQQDRVTQAFLKMKKFDIAELEKAYRGE